MEFQDSRIEPWSSPEKFALNCYGHPYLTVDVQCGVVPRPPMVDAEPARHPRRAASLAPSGARGALVTAPAGEWRRGVRVGIDVGAVRIGVARSDPDGILATPVTTVTRAAASGDEPPSDISEIKEIVATLEAVEVIVGIPVSLSGSERQAAAVTREYAGRLAKAIDPVPIRFADERMSTVVATRRLRERGVRGRRQRAVVDQAAAVEILQSWLDTQRRRT